MSSNYNGLIMTLKRKRVIWDYYLTSINVTQTWYNEDTFVLADQTQQVIYVTDLKRGEGWKVVEKVQLKGVWDIQEKDQEDEDTQKQEEYNKETQLIMRFLWSNKTVWIKISIEICYSSRGSCRSTINAK